MLKKLVQKLNKPRMNQSESVRRIRRSIFLQAGLGIGAIAAAAVLIFTASTAWYTNVAKTDTLTFEAESWGYDSDLISLSDAPISIAPGKNGIVPLGVDNSAKTENVNITVAVAKDKMEKDLQKRIFFYTDSASVLKDEQVSRVYVGSSEGDGCKYSIFPGEKLVLSENYYNDIPLKWEWVYDMQGYYFRGTVDGDNVIEEEYVRPIQYDMETAVFEDESEKTDESGLTPRLLEKINGVSVAEFLTELSAHDGYEGVIDAGAAIEVKGNMYYKVSVDGDGYGIWAYLCNYGEILLAQGVDNDMAQKKATASATVKISAQSVPAVVKEIYTEDEMFAAISNDDIDVIKFETDIAAKNLIYVDSVSAKTIDLNGHTLSYNGEKTTSTAFIMAMNDTRLTVMNGSVEKNAYDTAPQAAFIPIMSDLTLSNITSSTFDTAVQAVDHLNMGTTDSVVKIQNCNFTTNQTSVLVTGNADITEAKTKLIIQNSKINSKYYVAIAGNGSTNQWGTDIAVLDSTVSGAWGALYHPQQKSTMLIANSDLSGWTGICVKGGTVTVCDSTVTGNGTYAPAAAAGGAYTDTGDAIYIEANYQWSANVILKGKNNIVSENAYPLDLFGVEGRGPGRICVYDGADSTYSGGIDGNLVCWNNIGTFEVYNNELRDLLLPKTETADTEVQP